MVTTAFQKDKCKVNANAKQNTPQSITARDSPLWGMQPLETGTHFPEAADKWHKGSRRKDVQVLSCQGFWKFCQDLCQCFKKTEQGVSQITARDEIHGESKENFQRKYNSCYIPRNLQGKWPRHFSCECENPLLLSPNPSTQPSKCT